MQKSPEMLEWEEKDNKLCKDMEEFAEKFKCNKCSNNYCRHMLSARGRKFGNKVDNQMENLLRLSKLK